MAPPETPDRAEPLTRLIADRVAYLRKRAGLNQAELAERMKRLRPTWSRSTVVKLENYKRQEISAGDLIALALTLNVPVPILLADPRAIGQVPLAEGVDEPAWDVLLWMIGRLRITMPGADRPAAGGHYLDATALIAHGWDLMDSIFDLDRLGGGEGRVRSPDNPNPDADAPGGISLNEMNQRATLTAIARSMRYILEAGASLPRIPDFVWTRAAQLGVELPTQWKE